MKKIISILSLCFIFAFANESKAQTQSMTATTYTVIDTGTINLGLKLNESWDIVTVQYKGVKVSGTVAGTATLQGSVDGTNFSTIDARMFRDSLNAYTNTNVATNTKIFVLNKSPYLYYRVAVVGSGTMNLVVSAIVLPRK